MRDRIRLSYFTFKKIYTFNTFFILFSITKPDSLNVTTCF